MPLHRLAPTASRAFHTVGAGAVISVVVAGVLLASRWARLIGGVTGHRPLAAGILSAAMAIAAVAAAFGGWAGQGRRATVVGWCGVVMCGWIITTQPYSRTHTDGRLERLYDHVAPGYLTGLAVAGLVLVAAFIIGWSAKQLPRRRSGDPNQPQQPPFRRALFGYDRRIVDDYFRGVVAGAVDDMQTVEFPTRLLGYSIAAVAEALDQWAERRGMPLAEPLSDPAD